MTRFLQNIEYNLLLITNPNPQPYQFLTSSRWSRSSFPPDFMKRINGNESSPCED
ncbi:hypothetical protein HanXRQr2_Chr10g0464891 [Helianthus annuus]|uniref:Uncharacterized protein n=1 Tax=Helianthus annuus TaxID=4232 RepID=A0A251TQ52_HELAN|nr:hypothetical protein HanXRQr2_Chr10g0464891 [Helianthus annuus]